MLYSNLHTHSVFSDGQDTPSDLARRALELGFTSLGISDHSDTPYDRDFCLTESEYPHYREFIRASADEFAAEGLPIYLGIEKDYLSEIDPDDYDYVIGSVHHLPYGGTVTPIDATEEAQRHFIETIGKQDKNELAKRYFDLVAEHARTKSFQIQGHFDLVNKFGLFSDADETYRHCALEALDEVLANVPYFEVNTGALARGYASLYPADFILERLLEKKARLIVNSDCHSAEQLDAFFPVIHRYLKLFGFTEVWQKDANAYHAVPLDDMEQAPFSANEKTKKNKAKNKENKK